MFETRIIPEARGIVLLKRAFKIVVSVYHWRSTVGTNAATDDLRASDKHPAALDFDCLRSRLPRG